MCLIKILSYILYLFLCILMIFVILLLIDFFFDKNIINDKKLKKAQVCIIALTLASTIIKFFIEIHEKYTLVSDNVVLFIVLFFLLLILFAYLFCKK